MLTARHGNCSFGDAEPGRSREIPPMFTVSAAPRALTGWLKGLKVSWPAANGFNAGQHTLAFCEGGTNIE